MKPEEERILDAALEELLGQVRPPDLTARVLAQLGYSEAASSHSPAHETVPLATPSSKGQPEPAGAAPGAGAVPAPSGRRRRSPWPWAAVAALCAVAVLGLWNLWPAPQPARQQVVQLPQPRQSLPGGRNVSRDSRPQEGEESPAGAKASPAPQAGKPRAARPESDDGQEPPARRPSRSPSLARRFSPLVAPSPQGEKPPSGDAPSVAARPLGGSPRIADEDVVALIDRLVQRRWQQEQVPVAREASESTWCRRVYLDLLGRLPTVEELRRFQRAGGPLSEKKRRLVQQLLYGEGYREQWAANWASVWTVWLIGRTEGPMGKRVYRAGLQEYLYQALLENKPYDQLCAELLTATGSNRPGQPDYSGAVNFLLKHLDDKAIAATAQTARVFLGTQVQCTQCHNHPFNQWKQSQFWGLNAFFRQARVERGADRGVYRLVDRDFPGEGNRPHWDQAEVYYELRNGLLKVAYPTFLDGRRIDPAGRVGQVNRRRELARLVVSSPLFRQAVVNRLWAMLLGYGFTRPVDDLGPHNLPSHPELLDQLSRAFAASGYDLRRLMGWIVLSRPYGLSSRVPRGNFDDPTTGQPPLFSRFYMRQMRPEQLYDSLSLLAGTAPDRLSRIHHGQQRQHWVQRFMFDLDNDENNEATLWETSLTQTLLMWNGPVVQQVTDPQRSLLLRRLLRRDLRPREKVIYLFEATLSRRPSRAELQMALHALRQYGPRQAAAWSDLTWALVNSGEFLMVR